MRWLKLVVQIPRTKKTRPTKFPSRLRRGLQKFVLYHETQILHVTVGQDLLYDEWTAIKKARLAQWPHGIHTRVHTQTNTHTHTKKTLWIVFPVSSLWQTIITKKRHVHVSDTFSLLHNTYVHLQMIIFLSLHLHTNTYACLVYLLSFLRVVFWHNTCPGQ